MSHTNKEFQISKLIIKSVLGTLSREETLDFEIWINKPENKAFYDRILKEENFKYKVELFKDIDTTAAYSRLINRIEKKHQITQQKQVFKFSNLYKYAAVAVLLISIGYYSFSYLSTHKTSEPQISKLSDLEPGYNKATLVLEDGSEISLEKNEFVKEQGLVKVKNENNTLIYKSNAGHKTSKTLSYNTLYVPVGGIYKLELPDGTRVWLNSVSSLKYPTSFEDDNRIVELSGEAYFEVSKDVNKSFIVKTKTRDITVLGTAFNVSAYNDDAFFAATLTEGEIKLVQDNLEDVYLNPGEQAIVDKHSVDKTQIKTVDPKTYSTWKDGTFFFENESLANILKKVGRWYNFKPDFSDDQLSKITFTGLASKEFPAKRLLDRISKSSNIIYEINQNLENEESIIKISKKVE